MIQYPAPAVDGGRYPAKRCVGDTVTVQADVFRDGHELLRAVVRYRGPGEEHWREAELQRIDAHLGGVRWAGELRGRSDGPLAVHDRGLDRRLRHLARRARAQGRRRPARPGRRALRGRGAARRGARAGPHGRVPAADRARRRPARRPRGAGQCQARRGARRGAARAVERATSATGAGALDEPLAIEVDRERARFGAWYELFPRSWGGLKGVEAQLPRLAELGFDVLYLPPIHPIGLTNRKGANNTLVAGPEDPGSPYAIGDADGGHDAVHAELGTIDDVRSLCAAAREHGIDVALDLAINASADHPWLAEHPEWFHRRPDGTLKYAENPPKRYQDIYNFNWDSPDWRGLWDALLDVVLHWVDCGVTVFRVDNPHTKPFAFWAWLIDEVHARDRDVVFLAEAFTRRAVMRHLGEARLLAVLHLLHLEERPLGADRVRLRAGLFRRAGVLPAQLLRQHARTSCTSISSTAAARRSRHGSCSPATLSPSYGIYSGYEHCENMPVREGSEEYLDSEKYELKDRALDGALLPMIARINAVRHDHPALQELSNVTFLETANEALIAYVKRSGPDTVICVVNIDPHQPQQGVTLIPASLGLPPSFTVHDVLTDERFQWRIGPNFVALAPFARQAHVLEVER